MPSTVCELNSSSAARGDLRDKFEMIGEFICFCVTGIYGVPAKFLGPPFPWYRNHRARFADLSLWTPMGGFGTAAFRRGGRATRPVVDVPHALPPPGASAEVRAWCTVAFMRMYAGFPGCVGTPRRGAMGGEYPIVGFVFPSRSSADRSDPIVRPLAGNEFQSFVAIVGLLPHDWPSLRFLVFGFSTHIGGTHFLIGGFIHESTVAGP